MKLIKTAGLRFLCEDDFEVWRATTLLTKETGTVEWIREMVHNGDVFYDIGASIGIYSLLAAQQTSAVYAFEPQILSARSLMRNVIENKMSDRVHLLTCALHETQCLLPFNYKHFVAGSSGSQLGHTFNETGDEFVPQATELKYAIALDMLSGVLPEPNHIKIDVDGNEILVLVGMSNILKSKSLKSIQVEMHPGTQKSITEYLDKFDYKMLRIHHTELGKEAIRMGYSPEKVFYNAIFV